MASNNYQTVKLTDGREVCFSHGVPVAAYIPRDFCPYDADCASRDRVAPCVHCKDLPKGYVRTDARYSVTTSKHMNAFAGREAQTVPDKVLRELIEPLTGGGGR